MSKLAHTEILNIALFRTSSIGDVILATSCMDVLNELRQPYKVIWVGMEPSLSLIRNAFPDIKCVEVKKGMQVTEILKELVEAHFLVDLQSNLRSKIVVQAFKRKLRRAAYTCPKNQFSRNRLLLEGRLYGRNRELGSRATNPAKQQYQLMCDTLVTALLKNSCTDLRNKHTTKNYVPILPTKHDTATRPWQRQLKEGNYLAVAPGASYLTKRAPEKIFMNILNSLTNLVKDIQIVFLGDKKDRLVSEAIIQALPADGEYFNLAGELSLWETALALQDTRCLLSNDSSLGHMAEAVGTNVAVMFGPTVEGFGFAPHRNESRSFSTSIGCRPCSKHGKAPCRFEDQLCFQQIDVQAVVHFLHTQLVKNELDSL